MFSWYWAHVRPLCLLWIPIHIGWRPWLYVNFIVRNDKTDRATLLWTECTHLGECFSRSPLPQMYVRVLQNVLCWERIYISSFANASQVLIPMDGILHVQLKNKYSTSSKTLWTRFCELSGGVVTPWTGKWKPHRALLRINLDCATGNTAIYNTIRVVERWSTFNPASADNKYEEVTPLFILSHWSHLWTTLSL